MLEFQDGHDGFTVEWIRLVKINAMQIATYLKWCFIDLEEMIFGNDITWNNNDNYIANHYQITIFEGEFKRLHDFQYQGTEICFKMLVNIYMNTIRNE